MASSIAGKNLSNLVLGVCMPSLRHNASKFQVQHLYFDEKLVQYFKHSFYIYAYDPDKISKSGDIVLVQELPKRTSATITHRVLEVIYPCGDVTDPVTGKKVVASKFRDEIDAINALYGKRDSAFNYKKAPRRGWQEDRRDFSHRDTYLKYHEFEKGDENEDQPYSSYY